MLRTICTSQLPVITRLAPKAVLTRLPILLLAQQRNYSLRNIFHPSKEEDELEKSSHLAKNRQSTNEKPWDGEEPVSHSVLRMIMDKYRAPLRVEGAAKRNLPKPQSDYIPPTSSLNMQVNQQQEKSAQVKKMERDKKRSEIKQKRLLNAKDSAFDYAMNQKYPISEEKQHVSDNILKGQNKQDIDWDDWDTRDTPRSINEIGLLSDERIRAARARGEFDNLPGRGKPIQEDPLINNPFVDRTEYFLNRIIQRNGAAPPWIIMQQEVDTEVSSIRSHMASALKCCIHEVAEEFSVVDKSNLTRQFNKLEKSYYDKEVARINRRLRSYNVMCPEPVRKQLLELDQEIKSVFEKHGFK